MEPTRKTAFSTTREAAEALGVSLRTVQLWAESGILDAWKTEGGHRRISFASVERLLNKGMLPNEQPETEPEPASDRLRLLVVEDDNILLKLYKMRIASWKMPIDLTTASNGYEALLRIGRESPDLMIADLYMPGMDGFRMIRSLAASSFREGMEIVIVSGLDARQIEENGGLPPDIRCFTKPVPFAELRQIAEHMQARRAAMEPQFQ